MSLFLIAKSKNEWIKLLVWISLGSVVACGIMSLRWEVAHDSAIMLYCSRLVTVKHLVPYRDFFDMNQPLTYLLMAPPSLFGPFFDLASRVYDLALLVLICWISYLWLYRLAGKQAAIIAVSMFALRYFSGTWAFSLQREFLALLPLSVMMLLIVRDGWRVDRKAFLAGLMVGVLFLIKPQFILFSVLYAMRIASEKCGMKQVMLRLLFAALGFSLPVVLIYAWLVYIGAMPYYLEIFKEYLPLYGRIGGGREVVSGSMLISCRVEGILRRVISPYMMIGVAGLWCGMLRKDDSSLKLKYLITAIPLTLVVMAIAGQFWAYHRLHFYYFALLSGAFLFAEIKSQIGRTLQWCQRLGFIFGTIGLIGLVCLGLMRCCKESFGDGTLVADKRKMADDAGQYLLENLKPGESVQPLDWTDGSVHAMLIANAKPATRFIYSFHFYHHVSDPYIKRLRAEFINMLTNDSPDYICEAIHPDYPRGYDCTNQFMELEHILNQKFAVVREREQYRIWKKR